MTVTEARTARWCAQHRRPLSECEPWDRHNHSVRFREDVWADIGRTAEADKTEVVSFINEAAEARLGYIHCRRGSCMLDGPPVPVEFGDLTGKTLDEWLAAAVKQVERQHPAHEPVRIGAQPPARSGEGKDAATNGKPTAASTEPPAPVPVPRREAGRKAAAEPPVVAADHDIAAEVAELRAMVKEMQDRDESPAHAVPVTVPETPPGTAVFLDVDDDEPHIPYRSPEIPDSGRARGRAGRRCPHRLPAGAWCKACGQPK